MRTRALLQCFAGSSGPCMGRAGGRLCPTHAGASKLSVEQTVRVEAIGQRSQDNAGMVMVWPGDDLFLLPHLVIFISAAAVSHF